MTDLVKGVLGGAWSLVVGWILPTFLALQLAVGLIAPSWERWEATGGFLHRSVEIRQALLLAVAAVAGLLLSACQVPLYRVLEGYVLWPRWLQDWARGRQRGRRDRLSERAERSRPDSLAYALRFLAVARYPSDDQQVAPTRLGNAIRRFEFYARDRYFMDSQLLWNHLVVAAPERASKAVDTARTNVDFFIALLYGLGATALLSLATMISQASLRGTLVAAAVAGLLGAALCYRFALVATDEWDSATRALVDSGRRGLADTLGLRIPAELQAERDMWRAVNTFLRRPYEYSLKAEIPQKLERVRISTAAAPPSPPPARPAARWVPDVAAAVVCAGLLGAWSWHNVRAARSRRPPST